MFGARNESEIDAGIGDDAVDEFGRGRIVEGNCNRAAQEAAPKGSDPFRRIRAPEQHAVVVPDPTFFQLASAEGGHSKKLLVGPGFAAIPVLLDEDDAAGEAREFVEQREEVWAGHGSVNLRGPRVHHTPVERVDVMRHSGGGGALQVPPKHLSLHQNRGIRRRPVESRGVREGRFSGKMVDSGPGEIHKPGELCLRGARSPRI